MGVNQSTNICVNCGQRNISLLKSGSAKSIKGTVHNRQLPEVARVNMRMFSLDTSPEPQTETTWTVNFRERIDFKTIGKKEKDGVVNILRNEKYFFLRFGTVSKQTACCNLAVA